MTLSTINQWLLGLYPVSGLSGDKFKFNDRGDGPARYNIIHYKQVRPGEYEWVNVGFFHDDQIEMNMEGERGDGRGRQGGQLGNS